MHLTPAILEAAYTYLRATPPFSKWKLPEADAIEFYVRHTQPLKDGTVNWGDYNIEKKRIRISTYHKDLLEMLSTMAHEMVHIHQYKDGNCNSADHGTTFKRLAAQVCKQHGFDPKTF